MEGSIKQAKQRTKEKREISPFTLHHSRFTLPRLPRWAALVAVALAAMIYLPTIRYGFVWDDHYLIEQNEYLSRASPAGIFTHELFYNPGYHDTQIRMTYYRPLVNLSYFLERRIWGVNPLGYHLTNVLLHAGIAILLALILFELFHSTWLAGIGGILFAVHPATNSIVCFVANRTYLLAMAGIMTSFFCLVRGKRRGQLPVFLGGKGISCPPFFPMFFGLGLLGALLSQEASFAYAVIALGWLLFGPSFVVRDSSFAEGVPVPKAQRRTPNVERRTPNPQFVGVWLVALVIPCLCYAILRFGIAHVPLPPETTGTALQHPFSIVNSFGQQMLIFFVPFIQKVAYAASPALTDVSWYTVLGAAFLIVPLLLLRVRPRLQNSDFRIQTSLGYAWTVALLLPFAHLLTLGPSGRMLYLPAPGILIFLIAALPQSKIQNPKSKIPLALVAPGERRKEKGERRDLSLILYPLSLLVALVFAFQTLRRNPIWRDENTLNEVRVQEAPDSPEAHDNLGVKLREAGDVPGAIREHRRALELKPDFSTAHNNLGSALFEAGKLDEAAQEYRAALQLEPDFAMAHNNLGVALQETGKYDSAEIEYRQALRLEPAMALALNNLGEILMRAGKTDSAAGEFRQALLSQPNYALAHFNLGLALQRQGHPDDARREFEQTLKIMPDFRAAQDALQQLRKPGNP